jgi:ubiquinone/menaquinone biosynthesis C-methylase UbiE
LPKSLGLKKLKLFKIVSAGDIQMLTDLAHRLVANPAVYDFVQTLVGASEVKHRLVAAFSSYDSDRIHVLDVGAGTGYYRKALPSTADYICLDIDREKLNGFAEKYPDEPAVLADGTRMPLRDGTVDVVLCTMVTHHIPDALLDQFLAETRRVLKYGGRFILVDPVWAPSRLIGRLLWKYDRGSFPRTGDDIRDTISSKYNLERCDEFAVYHKYVLCSAVKA